jgi:transposase-like protein
MTRKKKFANPWFATTAKQTKLHTKKGTVMKMKNTNPLCKCLVRCGIALAVASLVWLPAASLAQEKGATKLLKPIKTVGDAEAVEAGDMVVMSCPKCRDSWVTIVEKPRGTGAKAKETTVQRHECPGCEHKYVTEGHGRAKTEKIVHVCKKCGSEDAFCCVMKKGEGPTPGMEKEKK